MHSSFRSDFRRPVASALAICWGLLLLCLSSGCAELGIATPKFLQRFQTYDTDPRATSSTQSPHERIERLRGLAKSSSSRSPEDQNRISNELVQQIRIEENPLIRLQIVRTLAVYPTAIASDVLEAGLNDQDEGVRIFCCEVWGKRGDQRAIELLGKVIEQEKDIDVQLAATRSLGKIRTRSALVKLIPAMKSKNPALKHLALESARSISGKALGNNVNTWIAYAEGNSSLSSRKPQTQAKNPFSRFN